MHHILYEVTKHNHILTSEKISMCKRNSKIEASYKTYFDNMQTFKNF